MTLGPTRRQSIRETDCLASLLVCMHVSETIQSDLPAANVLWSGIYPYLSEITPLEGEICSVNSQNGYHQGLPLIGSMGFVSQTAPLESFLSVRN